jgi:hypothetical protein
VHRFPDRRQGNQVPKVKKRPAAWTALERMTGQAPTRRATQKSVAQRRLKEGDPVGCRVTVTGKPGYDRREQWLTRVFPEVRPFGGFPVIAARDERTTTGVVDRRGQVTFHMEQPGVIPARTPYYEAYFQLVAGSSGAKVGGRYRTVETTATRKETGVALREGRRFPLRSRTGEGER